mgnify:CR=1 FL=1
MKRVDLRTIRRMDFMIQHKCTGSPNEFARRLNLSRSTFFEYLSYMRHELEAGIQYNKYTGTYYYTNNVLFK